MSEFVGEKTEHATPRRLEEAQKMGQFARSAEVQTVFVLGAGFMALSMTSTEIWAQLQHGLVRALSQLHQVRLSQDTLQSFILTHLLVVFRCVWPVLALTVVAGLLAGGLQSHFRTAPDALAANWGRANPIEGLRRVFSLRTAVPTLLAVTRLIVILLLSYTEIRKILGDPIFFAAVDVARVAEFLAQATGKILLRITGAMAVLATLDYAYQIWRTNQDLMMTKQEVKEELKTAEGNPQVKARQRQRRMRASFKKMLADVPQADVVVTNPTHLAVALRYDRKAMKAPRVVAKGSRLNALRIRELAAQHQVPIIENKPVARLLFKYGRVGGEVPAELYVAVAEILAWVYRTNRYRYYAELNRLVSR